MSKSLALQPLQTARHHSLVSFSKQHTTVSLAMRAASTSVLGKEEEQRRALPRSGALLRRRTAAHLGGADCPLQQPTSFYKLQILEGEHNKEGEQKLCHGTSQWLRDMGKDT